MCWGRWARSAATRSPPTSRRSVRGLSRIPAWIIAAALAALYLALAPDSADLPAQTYRAWLFEHAGFTVWDTRWYGGHHVPAYSVLFPPFAAVLGPRLLGALSAVVAAWAAERLLVGARGDAARPAALWFATGTAVSLFTERLTFALGLAFGAVTLLALARGRRGTAVLLALATALASPVAGGFLALLAVAHGAASTGPATARARRGLMSARHGVLSARRRVASANRGTAVAIAAAAVLPSVALSLAFPEGGTFPFAGPAFWPSLAATLAVLAVLPREERVLRAGAVLYAVVLIVSYALPTPMGGNAVRLGAILAGPVAALALWPRRRRLLLIMVPALAYWQIATPIGDLRRAAGDPSGHASYFAGVTRFLQSRPPTRVEVPFTDQHWEALLLARHVPIARGWERQLDRKVNALFYDGSPLTQERYRRWLDANAIGYVALPVDAPLDYSAKAEGRLVRSGAPYLREVWRDAHWRVFAVRDSVPLAGAGARVVRYGLDDLVLDAPRAGRVPLRIRWTPYWRLQAGRGCVARDGDWTVLELAQPGRVHLAADFAVSRIRASSPRCSAGAARLSGAAVEKG